METRFARLARQAAATLLGAAIVLAVPPVRAEVPTSDAPAEAPPVDELVREALERSPSAGAARARERAAREGIAPAAALPDPMLEVMYQDVGAPWDPMRTMSMAQVQYTQALPWPGRLPAQREAAAADARARAAEVDAVRRAVVREVRAAYARLYGLDRESESIAAARELLEVLAATAAARYASGQGEQEALVKAQLEASRLDERALDLAAQRAAEVATLNRLLDRPAGTPLGPVARLPEPDVAEDEVAELALARSPELAVRAAIVRAAEARLEAVRLEDRPGFLAGVGVGSTLAPAPVLTLRLGVELPLWTSSKNGPRVAQARAELEADREDLRAAEAAVRAEVDLLLAQWRRDRTQVVLYREAIVPRTAVALDAARASYLAGRGDFSTVVEDFRAGLDARTKLAGREAARFATWAGIERLTSPAAAPTDPGGER